MIKTLSRLEIGKNSLNFIKKCTKKSTVNVILCGEKWIFPAKIKNKTRTFYLTSPFQKTKGNKRFTG